MATVVCMFGNLQVGEKFTHRDKSYTKIEALVAHRHSEPERRSVFYPTERVEVIQVQQNA